MHLNSSETRRVQATQPNPGPFMFPRLQKAKERTGFETSCCPSGEHATAAHKSIFGTYFYMQLIRLPHASTCSKMIFKESSVPPTGDVSKPRKHGLVLNINELLLSDPCFGEALKSMAN